MEHEARANLLLDLHDRMLAISNRTERFAENPDNESEKQNILSDLIALKTDWTNEDITSNVPKSILWQHAEVAFSLPPKYSGFLEKIHTLGSFVSEAVCIELINKMRNIYIYISKPLAERIFKLYDSINHSHTAAQLLFEACLKSAVTAPRESFEYSMKLIEEKPSLLSGEGTAHPSYIYKASEQRTFDKCPICGGEGEPYYNSLSYRMINFEPPFDPFKLWMKCQGCGNIYTYKFPEDFLALSSHEKTVTPGENALYKSSNIGNAVSLAIWSNILNKLKTYNDKKALLEVGIGQGELLATALEMGYDANAVEIVEKSAQEVSDILGIPIWNGDFLHYTSDKTYPIIIMGDVIEHVTDPEAALRSAHRLLDDDGVLWLSTPNFESSFTRLKKFTDAMWCEPYHITYFSYKGLEALLEKCGFEVREYTVSNRYNGSMELIITKKK